jgi:hypothetical protein
MKIRLSRRTVIPARCEAHVEVRSAASGLYQILHHTKPSAPAVTLASGIAEIRANIPFRVRVINPTRRAHTLSKGMVIGMAAPAPVRVLSLESHGVGSLDSLDELGTPPASPGITDQKRVCSQSPRVAGTAIIPRRVQNPFGSTKSNGNRNVAATLETGLKDFHEVLAEPAHKDHKVTPKTEETAPKVSAWQDEVDLAHLPHYGVIS